VCRTAAGRPHVRPPAVKQNLPGIGASCYRFRPVCLFVVSVCAESTFGLLVWPTRANVVSGRYYGRLLAHPVPQIPLATTPSRSAWRQSLRAQSESAPTPDAAAAASRPNTPGTPGNHCRSRRRAGCTVSLAVGTGWSPPIVMKAFAGSRCTQAASQPGASHERWNDTSGFSDRARAEKPLSWNQLPPCNKAAPQTPRTC
jgi:hypothetical protein